MINIEGLSFDYGHNEILKDISVDIKQGQLYALFGPNGSGKTTLLKCIAGLLKYKRGTIMLMNRDIKALGPKKLSKYISYVPQEHRVSFPFTVEEVVLMGRTPHIGHFSGPSRDDVNYTEDAMERIGIQSIANRPYTELSGGQRQLVLLARAFAQDTPIIVLDEPTTALDFQNQINVWRILKSLIKYNKTVITCTHDPNHVSWFCDSVIVLNNGYIVETGPARNVMNNKMLNSLYSDICYVILHRDMTIVLPNI
jgi:iron complex transport system ATP-binding protein